MLSRKHYCEVAGILSEHRSMMPAAAHDSLVREFSLYFAEDNPRFDAQRFAAAAGVVRPPARAAAVALGEVAAGAAARNAGR